VTLPFEIIEEATADFAAFHCREDRKVQLKKFE